MPPEGWNSLWETVSRSDREMLAALQRHASETLLTAWQQPGHWQRVLDSVSPQAAALVQRIRRAGGSMPAGFVEAVAGPFRSNLEALSPRAYLSIHQPLSPLEEAYAVGLVWPAKKRDNQQVWTVPAPIAQSLAAVPALFELVPPRDMTEAPVLDIDGLLVAVASQIRAGGVQMVRGGRAPQRLVSAGAAYGASALVVQWLVAACLAGHALQIGVHGLQPGPVLDEWLRMSPHVRRQELLRGWLTAAWNDWDLTETPQVRSIDMRTARRCVAYALLPHLPDTWLTWDAGRDQIHIRWPDVVRPVSLQHRWQRPADWPTAWQAQDGVVIDMLLRGPLTWLGCVAWDSAGVAVRRTEFGAWISGLAHIEERNRGVSVSFEADFSCVLHDPTDVWARYQLCAIATQRDSATWQIEPQTIQRVVANGTSLDELLAILAELSGTPVSIEQRQQLALWAGMVAVVQVSHAVLVQTGDARAMTDLLHDRRIGLHGTDVLNDTTVTIPQEQVPRVLHALQHAGYAVHVAGGVRQELRENELILLERALRAYRDNATTRALAAKLRALREQEQRDG